jgi:hypothetical protein
MPATRRWRAAERRFVHKRAGRLQLMRRSLGRTTATSNLMWLGLVRDRRRSWMHPSGAGCGEGPELGLSPA